MKLIMMLLLHLCLALSLSLFLIPFKPIICSAWNFFIFENFSICDACAMRCGRGRGEGEGDGGEKDLKYAKIISDNAHVRHSPRSCLKCQKLCAASPRGSISGKGRVSWGVAGGEGGWRKVPLIGTWHAFVLECIFCSYLDAGPAGKTELCQEREGDRERGR